MSDSDKTPRLTALATTISGVLGKDVVDSSLEKVNDVKMSQSFFGRMFG